MNYCLHRIKYGPIFRFKHHLFDIKFHTLKQYNDFIYSKKCKLLVRLGLITPNYDSPIGIELWLSSTKDFDKNELDRLNDANLTLLAKRCELHMFQKAKSQYGRRVGTFVGILVTQEDYYYILMDNYGNKWYESCVGKLEFIKD